MLEEGESWSLTRAWFNVVCRDLKLKFKLVFFIAITSVQIIKAPQSQVLALLDTFMKWEIFSLPLFTLPTCTAKKQQYLQIFKVGLSNYSLR